VTNKIQYILGKSIIKRADIVKRSLEENGFIAICRNDHSAIEFVNEVAPRTLRNNCTECKNHLKEDNLGWPNSDWKIYTLFSQ